MDKTNLKRKLRFNDPIDFTESHYLYDCIEKLQKIKQIVSESNPYYALEDLEKIQEVLEKE